MRGNYKPNGISSKPDSFARCAAASLESRALTMSSASGNSLNDTSIATEVVVIGAGPAGLFQVFELGLLGIKAHVLDSLRQPGGQCTELYPDKPIYDIPALPICGAQELVDRLLQQIKPFGVELHLGEEAVAMQRQENGRFRVATNLGTVFDAGAVVYFLRKVIWTVPGFTVDKYHDRLLQLHQHIQEQGAFIAHSTRTLIEARKP